MNSINRRWGAVEFYFCLQDYEDFELNNIIEDLTAWDFYKYQLIHSFLYLVPEECELIVLLVECPFDGRSRNLWRKSEHVQNFKECEDCSLPWLLNWD